MIYIVARDIPDAWFQALTALFQFGREYEITHGSYVGQKRLEMPAMIQIWYPESRPLVPERRPGLEIPPPTTMEYVEEYLPYLMTDQAPKENETYTYGQRVAPQMEEIIRRGHTGSNQEIIEVARPEDLELSDPPCLRLIDTRIEEGELAFTLYFRSWDLWGGFPVNLAAIHLMQEYMAGCMGVSTGEIVAVSKGLHLYDHVWDVARRWVG